MLVEKRPGKAGRWKHFQCTMWGMRRDVSKKRREADWENEEKTQRREEKEEETRNGRERWDTPRGRRSCKFRDQRAIKSPQHHGE